jgi:hypothetical protein
LVSKPATKEKTDEPKKPESMPQLYDRAHMTNDEVSDGNQPPVMFDLALSESAGSRSLDRLVRARAAFEVLQPS